MNKFEKIQKFDRIDSGYPKNISSGFKNWPSGWSNGIDAALVQKKSITSAQKLYFFKGSQYIRYTPGKGVDSGYPKPIAGNWKKWPSDWSDGIDAAVLHPNGKYYFFKTIMDDSRVYPPRAMPRAKYIRYTPGRGVDSGYPKDWADYWEIVERKHYTLEDLAKGITSASEREGRIFLYNHRYYLAYDPGYGPAKTKLGDDRGYGHSIDGPQYDDGWNYEGDLGAFMENLDAEIQHPNGKVYSFKGSKYIRRTGRVF